MRDLVFETARLAVSSGQKSARSNAWITPRPSRHSLSSARLAVHPNSPSSARSSPARTSLATARAASHRTRGTGQRSLSKSNPSEGSITVPNRGPPGAAPTLRSGRPRPFPSRTASRVRLSPTSTRKYTSRDNPTEIPLSSRSPSGSVRLVSTMNSRHFSGYSCATARTRARNLSSLDHHLSHPLLSTMARTSHT